MPIWPLEETLELNSRPLMTLATAKKPMIGNLKPMSIRVPAIETESPPAEFVQGQYGKRVEICSIIDHQTSPACERVLGLTL